MIRTIMSVFIFLFSTLVSQSVADEYIPDVIEFNGSNSLVFPADERLTILGGGTIEFWVSPDWQDTPDYDPIILSNAGKEGPSYAVAIQRDKKGIIFYSGEQSMTAPFDFTDGKLHFVAITDLVERITILVDNTFIAEAAMSFSGLPSSVFAIGSIDGSNLPFIGAVAALRIWDAALDPHDLIGFAMKDINDSAGRHPDFDTLVGRSDFQNNGFLLQGYDSN